mgnify:CR=1 FL=1
MQLEDVFSLNAAAIVLCLMSKYTRGSVSLALSMSGKLICPCNKNKGNLSYAATVGFADRKFAFERK